MKYSAESTRNVVVVYGFFFVLLSTLISVAIQPYALVIQTRVLLYMMAWILALTSSLIGFGINEMLDDIHPIASHGFYLLSIVVPLLYIFFLGMVLIYDFPEIIWGGLVLFILAFAASSCIASVREDSRKSE